MLTDGFSGIIQPVRVGAQREQFDGVKEFHRVWLGPAQRSQFARADQDGDIVRRAVEKFCHLSGQQACWQIFGRPSGHRSLHYIAIHKIICAPGFGKSRIDRRLGNFNTGFSGKCQVARGVANTREHTDLCHEPGRRKFLQIILTRIWDTWHVEAIQV